MQEIACLQSRDCGEMQNSDGWQKVNSSYGSAREKVCVSLEAIRREIYKQKITRHWTLTAGAQWSWSHWLFFGLYLN